jgi:hypothetical protein
LFYCVDFADFTNNQRRAAFSVRPELSRMLDNALTQSELFSYQEVCFFSPPADRLRWKRFYSTLVPGPTLRLRLLDCMTKFCRKLIVIRASKRLTLGLLFQQHVVPGLNTLTTTTHLFSTDHGAFISRNFLAAGCFELDIDEDSGVLQIYLGPNRRNTFFWLRCNEEQDREGRRQHARVSVDLKRLGNKAESKIPLVTKSAVLGMEMYVISSADFVEVRHHSSGHSGRVKQVGLGQ